MAMPMGAIKLVLLLLSTVFAENEGGYAAVTFNYLNQCPHTIWLGMQPSLGETMWELAEDTLSIFDTPDQWTGTIWARTGCFRDDDQNFSCETGDCGTADIWCFNLTPKYPVTLINFSIQQSEATYDVSLVHGYNVPIRIVPDGGSGDCVTTGCPNNVMDVCADSLILANSDGKAIACQGPCDVLKDADACKSNRYSDMFRTACPLATLFPGDAKSHKCNAATYNITFCPRGSRFTTLT